MFKVGDAVFYKESYGKGIIRSISGSLCLVRFPEKRNFHIRLSISQIVPFDKKLIPHKLVVGDGVIDATFGEGIVKKIIESSGVAHVQFSDALRVIRLKKLVYNEKAKLKEGELEEKKKKMNDAFRVSPTDFLSSNSYSKCQKSLMKFALNNFDKGLGMLQSFDDGAKSPSRLGLCILDKKGVLVLKIFDSATLDPVFLDGLMLLYDSEKRKLFDRLYEAKALCSFYEDKKILRIPFKYYFVFQNVQTANLSDEIKSKIVKTKFPILFNNFSSLTGDYLDNFENYDINFKEIKQSDYGSIIERIIPENSTIFLNEKSDNINNDLSCTNGLIPITGNEKEFKALALDDEQIKWINSDNVGHHLTLANPGTGKSVLLLSKANRILESNQNSRILITCYNRNLCEKHYIFSQISGLYKDRIKIYTFQRLVIELLKKYGVDIRRIESLSNDDEKYKEYVNLLDREMNLGKIKPLFNAIYIDEVQLFDPLWIDICYRLLINEKPNKFYFELFGDLNQNVRASKQKGAASWQDPIVKLSWVGRTNYLYTNYRNTQIINTYLKNMIFEFNRNLEQYGLLKCNKEIVELRSRTVRNGSHKVIISNINPKNNNFMLAYSMVKRVIEKVKFIISKNGWNADPNDVAIIFPVGKFTKYEPFKKFCNLIISELDKERIDYSVIYNIDGRTNLSNSSGVILTTIDSSLGLDFKYVVFCGLYYFNFYLSSYPRNKHKVELHESDLTNYNRENAAPAYVEMGRQIYSACSRARDGLIIINDLPYGSPLRKIILPNGGKDSYVVE